MGNLFQAIVDNLLQLLPFVIVRQYQLGARWTRFGRLGQELSAGIHRKLYFYDQVEVLDSCDEACELPIQTVLTKDGHPVSFSANITYRIVDILAHWTVEDFPASIKAVAMAHLAKRVRSLTLDELVDLDKLETSLKGTLTTKVKDWGARVLDVGFINFSPTTGAHRIFLDIPSLLEITHHREH